MKMKQIMLIIAGIALATAMAEAGNGNGACKKASTKDCALQECTQDGSGTQVRKGERKGARDGAGKGERKQDGTGGGAGAGDGSCTK
jgi:hypothetical protein